MDAELDKEVREAFMFAVEKCAARKLPPEEKSSGKSNAVNKLMKESLDFKSANVVDAQLYNKFCDKTTKTITIDVFMDKLLPSLAHHNVMETLKMKNPGMNDPATKEELHRIKKKIASKLKEWKGETKHASMAVTDRLTNVQGYTGSHKQRFDMETGTGRGLAGRTDVSAGNSGYVSAYKGAGSYDKTH